MFCRVREERGNSLLPLDGLDEGFDGVGKNGILRAGGDHLVLVARENGEDLRAVRGSEMRAPGTDRHFSFARGPAVAQIFENFRAQSFHGTLASNSSG